MAQYGLTTFSPSGKLTQIEHAITAAMNGATTLGIKSTDGVVLVADKKTPSSLVDHTSLLRVMVLDEHVGCTFSGMGPDCRVLVDAARHECQRYRITYNEPIPIRMLARFLGSLYQEFTQSGGVRPFGCALLLAGEDTLGSQLYYVEPSGTFSPYKALALGKNSNSALAFLEKRYTEGLELEEAIHMALLTLKETFDGKMTPENTQVGRVSNGKFEVLDLEALKDYLDEV